MEDTGDRENVAHSATGRFLVPTTTMEWLALMQHFGAPTRVLDITKSSYVAAYFAIEDATAGDDCAVWAINES